ncbi:MAG: hypothetical protein K2I94_00340 [Muribaculaceae bacterium]|nr:hypothetical protein [Muribaculaceae bacterium]
MSDITTKAISQKEMNSYRLTSMEEPGDERLANVIKAVSQAAQEKWGDAINRIKDDIK